MKNFIHVSLKRINAKRSVIGIFYGEMILMNAAKSITFFVTAVENMLLNSVEIYTRLTRKS